MKGAGDGPCVWLCGPVGSCGPRQIQQEGGRHSSAACLLGGHCLAAAAAAAATAAVVLYWFWPQGLHRVLKGEGGG